MNRCGVRDELTAPANGDGRCPVLYLLALFAWGLAAASALPPPEAARAAAPTPTADERWLVTYTAPGGRLVQVDHRLVSVLDLLATLDRAAALC